MTDTEALERKITDSGLKKSYIAKTIGLSRQGLKNKIENKSLFTSKEINDLCEILKITSLKEKESIFFAMEVI